MAKIEQKMIQRIQQIAALARDELIQRISNQLNQVLSYSRGGDDASMGSVHYDGASSIEALMREESSIGRDRLIRRAAYLWFIRLVAIRYMEVNDYLSHHVRMLSSRDGAFEPECLGQALEIPLKALKKNNLSQLIQKGDDEAVHKELLIAQCEELRRGMPYLFDESDSAYDLLLPNGLLSRESFLYHLVCDIPEDVWQQGTDILSHLFEGYAESRKKQVKKGSVSYSRIAAKDLPVLSQTCTAGWVGHLLVDNALGRFLQGCGESTLSSCKYLVPTQKSERRVRPDLECISVMDYACGSGTLLAYAFDTLMEAYTSAGYMPRNAVRSILECNLHGVEVNERAALHAMLVLSMKGRSYDRRFLKRGIVPDIVWLKPVEFTSKELNRCKRLSRNTNLVDSLANISECGSLLIPSDDDLALINSQIEMVERDVRRDGSLLLDKLQHASMMLGVLAGRYDVILVDPPKMQARMVSRWFARWIAEHYPNDRNFLPACFIDRAIEALAPDGLAAVLSTSALLFGGMGSTFREELLKRVGLDCIVELTDSSGRRWSSEAAWFFGGGDVWGDVACVRLNQHPLRKEETLIKVVAGEESSVVFTRKQSFFRDIPGCPIAYWAPESMIGPIMNSKKITDYASIHKGLTTGNPNRFIREWYELSLYDRGWEHHPYANGGVPRKWYGNLDQVIRWTNDGEELKRSYSASMVNIGNFFKPGIVWGGGMGFRLLDSNEFILGSYGSITTERSMRHYLLGLLNSSTFRLMYRAVNSDGNCTGGEIGRSPAIVDEDRRPRVQRLVLNNVKLAADDDRSSETSWEFLHHPLCVKS